MNKINEISLKRIHYNIILDIRLSNQSDIDYLRKSLISFFNLKKRVLLDEKIKYDRELKSELIVLDSEINNLSGFKIK